MILTEKDFIVVEIPLKHMKIIEHNINEGAKGLITFQSWIRENEDRVKRIRKDQLTSNFTCYAASVVLTGSPNGYFIARDIANATPTKSDDGVDIFGLANVDVKGSFMSTWDDPLRYSLLVRPQERHGPDWVYINGLVPKHEPEKVIITGGCCDQDLPKGVYMGEYKKLHGAHKVDVKYLKSLTDIDQHIDRDLSCQERLDNYVIGQYIERE